LETTKEDSELKCSIEDLAIFDATPAFQELLHVGRPNIGNRERLIGRINDLLDRKWLTNDGRYLQGLEGKIANLLKVRHCIAICNATVALEIAIRAAGLTGEVIVPSMTFIATAHALQWLGITPVFCDIDLLTHNLDPRSVEHLITSRTTGIIGVHLWGRPCDVEDLSDIANRHKLKLLLDAAHAFGCSYKGAMVGNFGDAEIFSFHATKFINTFEGGAVVTNNDALAAKMRLMKNFGFAGLDNVVSVGTNGKMSEVSAAMGLTSLETMEDFIATSYRNYKLYQNFLEMIPGVSMLTYNEQEKNNYQYIVLEINEDVTHLNPDQLKDILWAENILARRYFYPGCHRMEPYRSLFPQAGLLLPHTECLVERVLSLPTGTSVGPEDIEKICGIIKFVVKCGKEIRERLIKKANKNNP
jgi:dTDP-4-amino-4,6-dideoxygalactose transaminase